jgi:hypothetical protein
MARSLFDYRDKYKKTRHPAVSINTGNHFCQIALEKLVIGRKNRLYLAVCRES